MSDLQATFEFSVELYKFYNVDLFQRGLYQLRVGLRVSPKVSVQIEASVTGGSAAARAGRPGASPALINGLAASRPFQIMYRNEEVTLRDIVHFRAQLLVDSRNLKDSLERAEWSLAVELWCDDSIATSALSLVSSRILRLHFQPSQGLHYHLPVLFDYFHLASATITIHASLVALHQPYIKKSIMQYVQSCAPRSSKQWGKLVKNSGSGLTGTNGTTNTLENMFFGGSSTKCGGGSSSKLAHARQVHAEVCGILLGSLEGLQSALLLCGQGAEENAGSLSPEASNSIIGEVAQRLKDLNDNAKQRQRGDACGMGGEEEEEFACGAAGDIARLCAEVTLRWRHFLRVAADRPHLHHALASAHHKRRIKRFSECFFVLDNPRHSLAGCYDSNYQSYQSVGEVARRSRYLALLPPLPVHCIALDGDASIMPIIFEDRYQDTAEFARRRSILSGNNNKSGSDPYLCSEPLSDDCACSISSMMDSRRPSSEASRVNINRPKTILDILEPKINTHRQSLVQATLTLAPQKSLNSSPKRTIVKQSLTELNGKITGRSRYVVQNNQISEIQMPSDYAFESGSIQNSQPLLRYSASNLIDLSTSANREKKAGKARSRFNESFNNQRTTVSGVVSTLPARHSKSLDQLRASQTTLAGKNQQMFVEPNKSSSNVSVNFYKICPTQQCQKPSTLPRSNNINSASKPNGRTLNSNNVQTMPASHAHRLKADEYRRNITEFREKYKNPCGGNIDLQKVELSENRDYKMNMNSSNNGMSLSSNKSMYLVGYSEQGNTQLNSYVHNPLEFQRGYNVVLSRPMLPPRNSYPPVNSKNQSTTENTNYDANKQIHRSNSTHLFNQGLDKRQHQELLDCTRSQLKQELQLYLKKEQQNYECNNPLQVSENADSKVKSHSQNSVKSCSNRYPILSKTPPSTPHATQPTKHKRTKHKEHSKSHHGSKDLARLNSSKDSLSSHHSSKSRDSKSDRMTPKSDRSTTKSEKKSKHRASEKMTQLISKVSTSSSNESIPLHLKRLESSASIPYKLDNGPEILRHCRSAASVLDEPTINNNVFSESLPNLAPPPAFESPPLDFRDKDFKIMPPETFKNVEDKLCNGSTSSLSEQSGWVSSGKSSGPSTPENTSFLTRPNYNTYPNPASKLTSKTVEKQSIKVINDGEIYNKPNTINDFKRTVLNGDQLRERLLKLAVKVVQNQENVECCDKAACQDCAFCSDSICQDTQCEYNKLHKNGLQTQCSLDSNSSNPKYFPKNETVVKPRNTVRHNSFSAIQNGNITHNYVLNGFTDDATVKKSHTITDNIHPYIRREVAPPLPAKPGAVPQEREIALKDKIEYTEKLLAAEIRSLTRIGQIKKCEPKMQTSSQHQQKCKSEVDLTYYTEKSEYEHLKLPPPQQFCDVPPPDAFRDPPNKSPKLPSRTSSKSSKSSRSSKSSTPRSASPGAPLQLDNPLYHVCETLRERRQLRPQSAQLPAQNTTLNKSQSTGELASRNDSDDNKGRENSLVSIFGLAESERLFLKCRDEFRASVKYPGSIYSDFPPIEDSLPYFHISDEYRMFNSEGLHLVVCVHGLDGNSADLRLVKTYLELGLPGARLDFLMSERNQGDTFSDFDTMTDRLVQEIMQHIQQSSEPSRISFVGHSLGTIIVRSALARSQMKPWLNKLHTFLSLSGPHLGTLYNSSGLVNAGMWFMQKWKKSGSLLQLSLRDASDPRRSFLYRLSERSQLHQFKHLLLCGSGQDRYVPLHSARLELCKSAAKDTSLLGQAYREMVHNIVSPLAGGSCGVRVVRYDVQHALPHTASALVGRAAHIAALDSDLFIEKFLLVSALKYFR